MHNQLYRLVAITVCLFAVSCTSKNTPYIQPPDMMEQLANADLSPGSPTYGGPSNGASGPRSYGAESERYPGTNRRARERRSFQKIDKTDNGYELNFNNASLSELAKVVLRDTLSIPYVFDPRVRGTVTISTGGPVTREELLTLLETVVSMNRGVLIKDPQAYRIEPEANAQRSSSLDIDYVSEKKAVGAGYGVSVFPVKHVSSDAILRMLQTFVGRQNTLKASVHNNLLVIRGDGKTRRSLLEVASMFDVDWMKGQSAGIFTLKNASTQEIISELNDVFRTNGVGRNVIRFKPISRLNAVLVLTDNSQHLDQVELWISRLDREGAGGDDYYVYRVENGKAKDLADILSATFSGAGGGTIRAAEETEVSPDEPAQQLVSNDNDSDSDDPTSNGNASVNGFASSSSSSSSPSSPSLSTGSVSSGGGGDIKIIPDETNNKLLIKAPARIYRKMLKVLRRIDKPPLQVLINATLAEVTLNDNLQYGVQFFLQNRAGQDSAFGFSNGSALQISPSVPGLNFIVGSTIADAKVIIDAIAAETAVRIVSSPSVVVLHNQSATLQVGDEVPIATRQVQSTTDATAPVVNEIEFRNTGVILKVTPRVNSNGLVTMEVEQEISAVTGTTATGDSGTLTPTISQRRISSTIAVQNGQMVVLGGLIREQIDREKSRVPILRKVPYLGDIVGNTDVGKARTELVVFLKPRVIREPLDASKVAEELRAQMRSLAPRPAPWDEDEAAKGGEPMARRSLKN